MGKQLSEIRRAAGWAQADVALALGISRSLWAMIETDRASLSNEQILAFEQALQGPKPSRPNAGKHGRPKVKDTESEAKLAHPRMSRSESARRAGSVSKFRPRTLPQGELPCSRVLENEILRCLKEADRPLSSVEVYERIDLVHRTDPSQRVSPYSITTALNLMARRGLLEKVMRRGKRAGKSCYWQIQG